MPTYLFDIENYQVVNATEIEGDDDAPQTLLNIDKNGTGSMALNALNFEQAASFNREHLRIHQNWNNPDYNP
jgi:hypothetical protein